MPPFAQHIFKNISVPAALAMRAALEMREILEMRGIFRPVRRNVHLKEMKDRILKFKN